MNSRHFTRCEGVEQGKIQGGCQHGDYGLDWVGETRLGGQNPSQVTGVKWEYRYWAGRSLRNS